MRSEGVRREQVLVLATTDIGEIRRVKPDHDARLTNGRVRMELFLLARLPAADERFRKLGLAQSLKGRFYVGWIQSPQVLWLDRCALSNVTAGLPSICLSHAVASVSPVKTVSR